MEDDAECMTARTRAKTKDPNPKRLKSKQSNAEKRAARTTKSISIAFPCLEKGLTACHITIVIFFRV